MDALHRMGITRWQVRVPVGNRLRAKVAHEKDSAPAVIENDSKTFHTIPASERAFFLREDEERDLLLAETAGHWPIVDTTPLSAKDSAEKASQPFAHHAKTEVHSSNTLSRPITSEKASSPSLEIKSPESVLSMRGRLLSGKSTNDIFVIACSEGRNKDVLIDTHQESGRLLSAMLKSALPAANFSMPSVLMLGADNGDKITIGKFMLLLGERAAKTVLGPDVKPPYRGKVHLVSGVHAVCTYHPEELRQNATLKPMAWDDLRLLASLWQNHSGDSLNLKT